MLLINPNSGRAHKLAFMYYATVVGPSCRENMSSAVWNWVTQDQSCSDGIRTYLIMRKAAFTGSEQANTENGIDSSFSGVKLINILCSYIELARPIGFLNKFLSGQYRKVSIASCIQTEVSFLKAVMPILVNWLSWRSLCSVLGPLSESSKVVLSAQSTAPPFIGKQVLCLCSEINSLLVSYNSLLKFPSDTLKQSKLHQHDTQVPSDDNATSFLQSHFINSYGWWSSSILSPHRLTAVDITNNFIDDSKVDEWLAILKRRTSKEYLSDNVDTRNEKLILDLNEMKDFGSVVASEIPALSSDLWNCLLETGRSGEFSSIQDIQMLLCYSVYELMQDILAFQIIVKCHLCGKCQDNIFAVKAAHVLIEDAKQTVFNSVESGYSSSTACAQNFPLSRRLAFLSINNFDLNRARDTYAYLIESSIYI